MKQGDQFVVTDISRVDQQDLVHILMQKQVIRKVVVFRHDDGLLRNRQLLEFHIGSAISAGQVQRMRRLVPLLPKPVCQTAWQLRIYQKTHLRGLTAQS